MNIKFNQTIINFFKKKYNSIIVSNYTTVTDTKVESIEDYYAEYMVRDIKIATLIMSSDPRARPFDYKEEVVYYFNGQPFNEERMLKILDLMAFE